MPLDARDVATHIALHALDALEQVAHMRQHGVARGGQLHAARRALEQGRAKGLLQILEPVAGRGRGDEDRRGTRGQTARLGNLQEQP